MCCNLVALFHPLVRCLCVLLWLIHANLNINYPSMILEKRLINRHTQFLMVHASVPMTSQMNHIHARMACACTKILKTVNLQLDDTKFYSKEAECAREPSTTAHEHTRSSNLQTLLITLRRWSQVKNQVSGEFKHTSSVTSMHESPS